MSEPIIVRGVSLHISEESFDDFELFELIDELDVAPQRIVAVFKRLFTAEEYEAIKEAIRNESGKVTVSAMMDFFQEASEAVIPAKN